MGVDRRGHGPQKTKAIEEALQLLYQHRIVFPTTDAALWTTLADHFPVRIPIVEVAKCWVVMTKTLQEQLMNVLLVTAAQNVDYALTVDEETVTMSRRCTRPLRASGGSAARHRIEWFPFVHFNLLFFNYDYLYQTIHLQ